MFPYFRGRNIVFINDSLNFENILVFEVSKDKEKLFKTMGNLEEVILCFLLLYVCRLRNVCFFLFSQFTKDDLTYTRIKKEKKK